LLAARLSSTRSVSSGLPFLDVPARACGLHLQTIRLVVAFLVATSGATLVVAPLLPRPSIRLMPISIARAHAVGMSYGALAVPRAMTARFPPRWAAGGVGWWIAAGRRRDYRADFTIGHTVA